MQHFQLPIPGAHTEGEMERKLLVANILGLVLTVFTGASVMPWIWAVAVWGWSHLSFLGQHLLPFPSPLASLLAPNWLTAGIWLGYYALVYLYASRHSKPWSIRDRSTPVYTHSPYGRYDPDREREERILGPFLYRQADQREEEEREWGFSLLTDHTPKPKPPPLSQAWPGEAKHDLVERCYAEYRKALQRYDPAPIHLHTPRTFFYHASKFLAFNGTTPILPEEFLCEEKLPTLRALLAQHLYWYNLDISTSPEMLTPNTLPVLTLLALTGNWLWIPVRAAQHLQNDLRQLYTSQQKGLVLEADAFAALLGQGPQLERMLRQVQHEMKQNNLMDTHAPTIAERIGHLEVINKQEREELRRQGLKVKEPPKFKPDDPPRLLR